MFHRASLAAVFATALALSGCELLAGRTGGGTETETAGVFRDADGTPAVSARVMVRPADYLADSLLTSEEVKPRFETWTDASGRFRLRGLPAGAYRLEAEDGMGRGFVYDFVQETGKRHVVPTETLRPHGSISGSFAPDSNPNLGRFVQIYGLERLVKADPATGAFMVNGLPPGAYDLRFLGIEAFRKQKVLRGVKVVSGEVAHLETVALEEIAKLSFQVEAGALAIDGVDAKSPVIFDNEFWDNGPDNEYVWAKASKGDLDLRGNLVTDAMRPGTATVDHQLVRAKAERRAAQLAGLGGIPDPLPGSRRILQAAASGRLEDILTERSAGSDLIVAEARKATPEKPLVVVCGGALTTVANAYLADPSIAPRMVVAAIYPFTINASDSVAAYVVAKRCRMLVWGRNYVWKGSLDTARLDVLPRGRMGERLRGYFLPQARSGRGTYGDLAPAAYLFSRKVWTGAEMAKFSPPLSVTPASGLSFDFLDVPEAANDWAAYADEYFATLGDTALYAPSALPGRVEAEGYSLRSGPRGALTAAGSAPDAEHGDAMAGSAGNWLEFRVAADSAATRKVALRYRSAAGGRIALSLAGGATVEAALPASADWTETELDLPLLPGTRLLRASWKEGIFDLDWLEAK